MVNNGLNIEKQLRQQVQQIEKETKVVADQSIWQTLQEIKPKAEEKLREIIIENFYNKRPESEWYDRTYQFANCGVLKTTQGGGHYVMQLWLDTTQLRAQSPMSGQKGMFWSYAYSYGGKGSLIGTPLELEEKQQLVDEWNEEYNISEEFEEWFEREFHELFDKNFNIRLRRVLNYKTW